MHTVTSHDGTRIAYWRSGSGPPLLLVHGAIADHTTTWRAVLSELERHFTVYAMDRRGRGGSGDTPVYELQREAEDIAAIVDTIGEPVNLFGHSYGALCALEASLLTTNLRRLILYEGVPIRGVDRFKPGAIARLEALLTAGDLEGMLITMLGDVVGMPATEIAILRNQQAAWAARLANAASIPRELNALERYHFAPERFSRMHIPTLVLVGEESPPRDRESARSVAEELPNARLVVLAGQRQIAMHTAPALFVQEVVRFLEDGSGNAYSSTSSSSNC